MARPDEAVSAANVWRSLERETGIEPATNSLEGCDSTTELLPPPATARPARAFGGASPPPAPPRPARALGGARPPQSSRRLRSFALLPAPIIDHRSSQLACPAVARG